MFGGIGIQEIVIILIVGLLVFGATRLPKIARSLGQGIKEFKKTVKDLDDDSEENTVKYVEQGPGYAQPGPYGQYQGQQYAQNYPQGQMPQGQYGQPVQASPAASPMAPPQTAPPTAPTTAPTTAQPTQAQTGVNPAQTPSQPGQGATDAKSS